MSDFKKELAAFMDKWKMVLEPEGLGQGCEGEDLFIHYTDAEGKRGVLYFQKMPTVGKQDIEELI